MRCKAALVLTIVFALVIYSFLFYVLSFAPFLGITFENYIFSFVFVASIIGFHVLFLFIYYHFYDSIKLLRYKITPLITGFLLSVAVFQIITTVLSSVGLHKITMLILSILICLSYHEDPNSLRSLKRSLNQSK